MPRSLAPSASADLSPPSTQLTLSARHRLRITGRRQLTASTSSIAKRVGDAGGPTAVNFALQHPERTAAVCLMNAFYGDAPGLRVPEFIELFANKGLKSLTRHLLAGPQQFAWLLAFQATKCRWA